MSLYYEITIKDGNGKLGLRSFRLKSNLLVPSPVGTEVYLELDDPVAEPLFAVQYYRHYASSVPDYEKSEKVASAELGDFYMILSFLTYDPEEDDLEVEVENPETYWRALLAQGWEEKA